MRTTLPPHTERRGWSSVAILLALCVLGSAVLSARCLFQGCSIPAVDAVGDSLDELDVVEVRIVPPPTKK
jgi:hypothetical protein